jgi:hypothetical protein
MESRVWQRYIAVACSQAWRLDVSATEELLRCIEALLAESPLAGSAKVKVFLDRGVGEIGVERRGDDVRVNIRLRIPPGDSGDGADRGATLTKALAGDGR